MTKLGMGCGPEKWLTGMRVSGVCVLFIAVVAAGCARSGKQGNGAGAYAAVRPPKPPPFLNGPMALLLTNVGGFSAHAVLESGVPANGVELAVGELLGRNGNLLFAPGAGKSTAKRRTAQDFAFIWDVAVNRGYLLNDPLQGYAPITYGRLFTNVTTSAALNQPATESISGHRCQQTEVTVAADDGSASVFHVWRATDLKGLPIRISGTADGTPVTLTLSKVRLEPVPNDLFQPPNGFTKYASAERMMDELFLRRNNLKPHPSHWSGEEDFPTTPGFSTPFRSY